MSDRRFNMANVASIQATGAWSSWVDGKEYKTPPRVIITMMSNAAGTFEYRYDSLEEARAAADALAAQTGAWLIPDEAHFYSSSQSTR